MVQDVECKTAGFTAHFLVLVLEDHVVLTRVVGRASLAKADVRACDALQLQGDVFHHVPKPGAFVFFQAPDESPRRSVRAAVLVKTWQVFEQGIIECRSQAPCRPLLQHAKIQHVPDYGEPGIDVRADENVGRKDLHLVTPLPGVIFLMIMLLAKRYG